MQWTGARNHNQASIRLGLDVATVHRIAKGKYAGMRIETLDHIQRITDVPIETLFGWYRLPEGAALGRVKQS
jgi:hypothetical protein